MLLVAVVVLPPAGLLPPAAALSLARPDDSINHRHQLVRLSLLSSPLLPPRLPPLPLQTTLPDATRFPERAHCSVWWWFALWLVLLLVSPSSPPSPEPLSLVSHLDSPCPASSPRARPLLARLPFSSLPFSSLPLTWPWSIRQPTDSTF